MISQFVSLYTNRNWRNSSRIVNEAPGCRSPTMRPSKPSRSTGSAPSGARLLGQRLSLGQCGRADSDASQRRDDHLDRYPQHRGPVRGVATFRDVAPGSGCLSPQPYSLPRHQLAPYPTDRLHNQHPPPPASRQSRQPTKPEIGGSILDADDAPQGVNFARRNTQLQPRARPTPAVAAIYRFPPTDSLSASTGVPEIWQRVLDELPNAKSLAMEVQNTQAIVKVGGFSEIKAKLLAACDAMDR